MHLSPPRSQSRTPSPPPTKKRLIGGRNLLLVWEMRAPKKKDFFRWKNKIACGLLRQNNSRAYIYELRGGLISCFLSLWCEWGPGVAKKRREHNLISQRRWEREECERQKHLSWASPWGSENPRNAAEKKKATKSHPRCTNKINVARTSFRPNQIFFWKLNDLPPRSNSLF